MRRSVLALNSGSSSLKASLFRADGRRRDWHFKLTDHSNPQAQTEALDTLFAELDGVIPDAIGHRFVHGGDVSDAARILDEAEIARLRGLVSLAPMHMPGNLRGVEGCQQRFDVPQIACFDTAFHHKMPDTARRLPIPQGEGMRRYGFHGLNYAYIASRLPALLGDAARGRIVVAHLGSGVSLCLLDNLQSVDTTMGYTPAGGIVMGSRSGDLDPGVMLELGNRNDHAALSELIYYRSGLLALSDGESGDMAALMASQSEAALFAIDYFCRQVQAAIGAMAAKAGGIDALVFSGGIGEHAPKIRARICEPLRFLGFSLDAEANQSGRVQLQAEGFKPVLRIAANEEEVMRELVESLLGAAA